MPKVNLQKIVLPADGSVQAALARIRINNHTVGDNNVEVTEHNDMWLVVALSICFHLFAIIPSLTRCF